MIKHIGIVGCSAEGAALCYRTICTGTSVIWASTHIPEVTMHTHLLADYVKLLNADDLKGVGDLMLSSANKLARAGADLVICPDNTIHQALAGIEHRSPLPWLHIASEVSKEASSAASRRSVSRVRNGWSAAMSSLSA